MGKNTGLHIVNMIRTRRGTHPLFRSFGIGGIVDNPSIIARSTIQTEIARWYPGARIKSIRLDSAAANGEFAFTVETEGV